MARQSFKNHVRYYAPHHFVFYPVLMILFAACIILAFYMEGQALLWIAFALMLLLLGWLSFMMRQHYALGNQNRIVRLEMRFRYFVLTGSRFDPLERDLTFGQIAALRFCSDDELPGLLHRAITENLTPNKIKMLITQWQGDYMRL